MRDSLTCTLRFYKPNPDIVPGAPVMLFSNDDPQYSRCYTIVEVTSDQALEWEFLADGRSRLRRVYLYRITATPPHVDLLQIKAGP